jgi:hypothetical protein
VIAPYRPHGPAPESETTLLVIAKPPLPGRVKTRMVPPCTPHGPALLIGMDTPQLTRRLLTVDWQVADAVAVARLAPRTRFAAQVRELAPVLDLASSACPGGTTARERQ